MKQIAFWDDVAGLPVCLLVPATLLAPPVDTQALYDYRLTHCADWQPFDPPAPAALATE